jgi:predicted lipid carrier protein YhbT
MKPEFNAVAIARKVEEKVTVEISLADLLLIATAIQDAYEAGLKDCLDIADQVVDEHSSI